MSCKWWRLVHHPRSPKYNGKHSILGYECACPLLCQHNTVDEKMGGCFHQGEAEYEPLKVRVHKGILKDAVKVEG